ncbi:hypothetical protein IQ251_01400 [Saccharopolyspora sp. HNM0983]|uniref:Uncharacterized protein n=1 Tax=Saccharopolyspora montiporae TaxID=2781240 RepID=A0A929B4M1_9PSEU|nr:hypothetical protein [Saccharopolyspora sp. HNM0983]MBE9373094.1 hypothetical protein [Saccharopolyspora sp. HNM0983]
MAMLIEVEREERIAEGGHRTRPRARSAAAGDVRARLLAEGCTAPRREDGPAAAGRGSARRDDEWLWLLAAGLTAFVVVLLLGLFGAQAPSAGGGGGGEVLSGETRQDLSAPVDPLPR